MKKLFILAQFIVPQHLLSRLAGQLADTKISPIKNFLINRFINHYQVNMAEAAKENAESYVNFNHFFTRELKPDIRLFDPQPDCICSPADGAMSALGEIDSDKILQAKNKNFSLTALLGGNTDLSKKFRSGTFATIYLSPKDYHRVHMPISGQLQQTTYVPGDLFSVNNTTANNVDNLFARNERLICIFETELGPMAMILVGAMIVAGIETTWSGPVAAHKRQIYNEVFSQQSGNTAIKLAKGDEMGRFKLGSTVILLFGPGQARWDPQLSSGSTLKLGQKIGTS